MKSVLWRVAKRLSLIQEARCLKFNIVYGSVRCSAIQTNHTDALSGQTVGAFNWEAGGMCNIS